MCSVSDKLLSSSARTSSGDADGKQPGASAPRRRRFAGGAGDATPRRASPGCAASTCPIEELGATSLLLTASSAAAASWRSAATGTHCHRNQLGARPSSRWCCHWALFARRAASTRRWNSPRRGPLKARPAGDRAGSRNLLISTCTNSSMVVGKKECRWRIENRLLMRFSSIPMTSMRSDIPMMERCTPTSWAMSNKLYNNVCLALEQKYSNLSSTMTAALACWNRSVNTARSHSMPDSNEAFALGAFGSWPATWETRCLTHSMSVL
mmetsp:Transcript_59559/g.181850  ORF Transcript_59559/g.181850 Transcript_59559/m.181850 type:complete len:267 (-) Transcript_59559:417-1217(-)